MKKRLLLPFLLLCLAAFQAVAQNDKIYIANGKTSIHLGNTDAVSFAGGAIIDNDTLDFADTLYMRGEFAGYLKIKRAVIFGGLASVLSGGLGDTCELMITSGLKVQGGNTFFANGETTLLSTPTGTGSIEELSSADAVSGLVTMQRYVPGGRRSYRLLSHPFNSAKTLTETLLDDIDVTGQGGLTNGFSQSQTNNPSSYYFNAALGDSNQVTNNPGWKPYTSATTASWQQYQAANVMIRGAKGEGLYGQTYTPSAVTLDFQGNVNQQNQTIPLVTGVRNAYHSFNNVGNPYPSNLKLKRAINAMTNLRGSGYWVWNSAMSTGFTNQNGMPSYGKWETVLKSDEVYLPSSSAFAVDVNAAGNIVFFESDKAVDTSYAGLFKTTNFSELLEFRVYSDSGTHFWDNMFVMLDPAASDSLDSYDAGKPFGGDVNFFAYSQDGYMQSIATFPYGGGKIVPLGFSSKQQKTFEIRVNRFSVDASHPLYLYDNYLNVATLLSDTTVYAFSVTSDSLSQGQRFQLGIPQAANVNDLTDPAALWTLYPNPNNGVFYISTGATLQSDAEIQVTDMQGRVVSRAKLIKGNLVLQMDLSTLSAGVYTASISTEGASRVVRKFIKR